MKKIFLSLLVVLGTSIFSTNSVKAQDSIEAQIVKGPLFDAVTGMMAYNAYNNNCYVFDLFKNRIMSSDDAVLQAGRQERTLAFVAEQIDAFLVSKESENLKASEKRYFKDLKKALISLRSHAELIKQYAKGDTSVESRINDMKDLSWKMISSVMDKQ